MKRNDEKKMKIKPGTVFVLMLLVVNVVLAALLVKNISELKRLERQFSKVVPSEQEQEDIQILLPENLYVAKDITMEVYNSQVTGLGADITKYNVCWKCDIGENLERKFAVTADENNLGSYELVLEIYDNELELVASKSCKLILVENDPEKESAAKEISGMEDVPEECMEQVRVCVDTAYNGTLDALKAEGLAQMQDVIYSVLCGI